MISYDICHNSKLYLFINVGIIRVCNAFSIFTSGGAYEKI